MKRSGDDIWAHDDLEFRSTVDDAWYSVRVVLESESFTVKFVDFTEAMNERFNAGDFQTLQAVDDFVRRFRPVSTQSQDSQCSKIVQGLSVCSSFEFKCDDVRFYDAVVEAVHYEEHSFAKEEECMCTFVLCWQHGPNLGNLSLAKIANICIIQSAGQPDFRVASFAKMAKEKLEISSHKSGAIYEGGFSLGNKSNYGTRKKTSLGHEAPATAGSGKGLSRHGLQKTESARQFGSAVRTTEGWLRTDQDRDLGGESVNMNGTEETCCHHFILLENLETDLSPLSITEFIQKQTSIRPLAYVFPSLSSETFAKGLIGLDCEKKHKNVYQFLDNPDHFIMSTKGRPWVISEKSLRHGTFRTKFESLIKYQVSNSRCGSCELQAFGPCPVLHHMHKIQNKIIDDELKIVHSGTEEYRTATCLRDLYKEFVDHQKRLHWRLTLEEREILQLKD
ncbi:uncharacterized protein LOC132268143 [Cornus florida]|uniref:uncharacterized protein LOC132268143 n=1 Tax=Cornus florida TaxID=4283 RepID=UPI00289F871F|nr:uncharacterized protein LOC132268143 [Cornus florida]XP_059624889.1 uncharacterized protein LOC132268143 [Cornus florida]XP_059624890.1 uncharacterized protein LOC132268143 [Cornus florida]